MGQSLEIQMPMPVILVLSKQEQKYLSYLSNIWEASSQVGGVERGGGGISLTFSGIYIEHTISKNKPGKLIKFV